MRSAARGLGVLILVLAWASTARAQLVVLAPTGEVRDGLQVLQRHPDPSATEAALTRGFSGRMLRLYALEQEFLRRKTGRAPEPAYLLLSNRQGGFPQFGFYLGAEKKPDAGWVDLHYSSRLAGEFGAMDQIFPHELLHVIVRQLAGEPRESGGNQMHAIGVRTDPVNAFNEGFAEHVQILAIDDPDALAATHALAQDDNARARADRAIDAYAGNLDHGWWPIQPARMRFLLWYNQTEQVLRYHAVKANLFARAPAIPPDLLEARDKYPAYLFQNVVPGALYDPPKSAGVMLSTDGAVSHLFWRLATDSALQNRYRDQAFYEQFGTSREGVSPLENVYLKIFAALYEGHPSTTVGAVQAWIRVFPEDAVDVNRIVSDSLIWQRLPDAPEIWLANDALMTGTSLFDQYRGLPRVHTFDANAATTLDWLSVPGVAPDLAAHLIGEAPYPNVQALRTSEELPVELRDRIGTMSEAMTRLLTRAADEEESLSLSAIIVPYLWRLAVLILVTTTMGAVLVYDRGVKRWWTAALLSLAASLLVVAFAWIVTSPASYRVLAPIVIGGLPWMLWRLARRRDLRSAVQALWIWALAAFPALALTL